MLFPLMANLYYSLVVDFGCSFKVNLCHMHVHCIYKDYICSFQEETELYSVDFICLLNILLCSI